MKPQESVLAKRRNRRQSGDETNEEIAAQQEEEKLTPQDGSSPNYCTMGWRLQRRLRYSDEEEKQVKKDLDDLEAVVN